MSHDFVCRIPLKPNNEPPKEDEVRKLLTNPKFRLVDEFAVRYLESIGAAPTPANIRKVKSEIPVKRFKLKAACEFPCLIPPLAAIRACTNAAEHACLCT
jgi:hypothetical protein